VSSLGHSNLRTTMQIYARVSPQMLGDAADTMEEKRLREYVRAPAVLAPPATPARPGASSPRRCQLAPIGRSGMPVRRSSPALLARARHPVCGDFLPLCPPLFPALPWGQDRLPLLSDDRANLGASVARCSGNPSLGYTGRRRRSFLIAGCIEHLNSWSYREKQ